MNFRKILACLSAVILVFSLLTVTALASSGNVSVSITASPAEARPGQEVTLTFTVHNDTNKGLGGLEFTVTVPEGFTATGEVTSTATNAGSALYTGNKFTFSSTEPGTTGFTDKTWDALVLKVTADRTTIGDQIFSLTIADASDGDNGNVSFQKTSECKVKVVHTAAGDHTEATEHTKLPNCTEQGTDTVKCSVCGATLRTTSVDALGHQGLTIGEFIWSVASDNTSATATAHVTCNRDGCKYKNGADEQVTVTGPFTEDASCNKPGTVTFKGTITIDGETKTGEKTVQVDKLPHTWEPSFQWSADHASATASRTCSKCGTTEQATEVTYTEEGTKATCVAASTYKKTATAKFTDGDTETDTYEDKTAALGHQWGDPTWTWQGNTVDGVEASAIIKCTRVGCNADAATKGVTLTVTVGEPKVTTAAKCTTDGVATCTATGSSDEVNNGKQYTNTKTDVKVPAIGHKYAAPTVAFTGNDKDGYTSATATWVCENDGEHKITRTDTELDTEEVAATYAAAGSVTYKADFKVEASDVTAPSTIEKSEFSETKEVEIPKLTAGVTVKDPPAGVTADTGKLASDVQDLVDAALTTEGEAPGIDENLKAALKEAAELTDEGLTVTTELKVNTATVPGDVTDGKAAITAEITVTVQKKDGTPVGDPGKITEVKNPIELKIAKPAEGGPIFYVVTDHTAGEWTEVSSKVVGNDIVFSTTQFSTFVVVGTDDLADAEIEKIGDQTYTGKAIEPAVKVTINGGSETLEEGVDYEVVYEKNTDVGTATVTIKAKEGGRFSGTQTVNFNIVKAASTATNAPAATKAPTAPGTGDETPVALFAAVLTACAAALGVVLFLVRRRQQQK